jgi:DNA-directed RNA polymerase subunit RPC12/RpoP
MTDAIILVLFAIPIACYFLQDRGTALTPTKICKTCGEMSDGKASSNFSILVFLILALFLVVPAIIYALIAGKRRLVCPECGSAELVSVASPVGRQLVASVHTTS